LIDHTVFVSRRQLFIKYGYRENVNNYNMVKKYFQLDRKIIALVQFIIEGYGEMASVTTMDSRKAIIRISIIPDFISEMNGLIKHLEDKYEMLEIDNYRETDKDGR
jgi:hypothetical protein